MAIKPVSGEIKAQVINDNLSYLDSKTSQMIGGPKETFTSVSALQSKYPNGSNSAMLVTDASGGNGYLYTWNGGAWIKGPLYQAQGIADLSIDRKKIKDNAVNHLKTNYMETGKNKFLNHEIRAGGYVNYVTGKWHDDPKYSMSGKVDCIPGQNWSAYPATWIVYYLDGQHVGGFKNYTGLGKVQFVIPEGVNNFEMGFGGFTGREQIEQSADLSKYEKGYIKLKEVAVDKEQLKNFVLDAEEEIINRSIESKKMSFIKNGKNKYNYLKTVQGEYINPANGESMTNPDYSYSDFIDIKEGTHVALNLTRFYATYDANKNFVRGGTGGTVEGPVIIEKLENEFFLRTSNKTSLNGQVQIEFSSVVTAFEKYYEYFEGINISEKDVIVRSGSLVTKFPNKLYATKPENETYLFENIFVDKKHDFEYSLPTKMSLVSDGLSIDVTANGAFSDKLVVFDSMDQYVENKSINISISNKRTTPLKVLLIGDSTVRSNGTGEITKYLKQYFGNLIELVGTMGADGNFYEGRGGWTAERYLNSAGDGTYTNAFYNPSSKKFDLAYYLQQNNFAMPDVIIFQLGINDMFRFTNDSDAFDETVNFFDCLDQMRKNIQQFNSNIKVAYNIPFGPTTDVALFDLVYKKSQFQQRYQRNNAILVSEMIKKYSGIVDLVPIHLTIDRRTDFADGVHLQQEKYIKPAKIIRNYLNSI